jgi:glycosyltransferase involved in cell wall biosynthesis
MSKIKRIAFVTNCLEMGGIEKLILEISRELDKNKFLPFIYVFQDNGKLKREFENENIPVFVVSKKRGLAWTLPFKLGNLFKEHEISLINTHNQGPWLYGVIASFLTGIPLLHTEHTTMAYLPKKASRWKYIEWLLALFTKKITTVSKSVADYMVKEEKINNRKIKVIYNGIDPKRYAINIDTALKKKDFSIKESEFVIGNIASLSSKKDQNTLLRAFSLVIQMLPNVRLLIAGDGPLRAELNNLTKNLGIEEKVSFLGNRMDVPELLKILDVFVLSSIMEGFPIVLIEAMAAGVPIVATNVDGNSESVIHNQTGFIVKPKNVTDMANAIFQILSNKEKAMQMGETGTKRVIDLFTFDKMILEYEKTYLEIAK